MTTDLEKLAADLGKIAAQIPEIPNTYAQLRAAIEATPAPLAPDLRFVRDHDALLGKPLIAPSLAQTGLAGQSPGQESGAIIGRYPDPTAGSVNLLTNPTLIRLGDATLTTTPTTVGEGWQAFYVLNSGTVPPAPFLDWQFDRDNAPADNPFNSTLVYVTHGNTTNQFDFDFVIQPNVTLGSHNIHKHYPFLVAACRLSGYHSAVGSGATVRARMELFNATDSVTVAGEWLDIATAVTAKTQPRIYVATPVLNLSKSWRWRLRINIVKTTSANSSSTITFGEPQLHTAFTPDPVTFAPLLGRYIADTLRWKQGTEPSPRTRLDDEGLRLGPGTSVEDVRIWRSATATARITATTVEMQAASGSATLDVVGTTITDTLVLPPSATQVIDAASDVILANASVVLLNNTTGGPLTLTSTPMIADGVDGQMLWLVNISANNISLQSETGLTGSNLRLGATPYTLTQYDTVGLVFIAALGWWVQISSSGNA